MGHATISGCAVVSVLAHARSDQVDGVVVSLGISRSVLDCQSLDGGPVYLVFLILSSEVQAYMRVLSRTARVFNP